MTKKGENNNQRRQRSDSENWAQQEDRDRESNRSQRISVISVSPTNPNMLHPRLSTSSVQIATGPKFLAAASNTSGTINENIPGRSTSSLTSTAAASDRIGSGQQLSGRSRMVLVCLAAVCVSMLLCWIPILVTSLLGSNVSPFAHQVALCVACVSTVTNPLLYGAYNRNIRNRATCRKKNRVATVG